MRQFQIERRRVAAVAVGFVFAVALATHADQALAGKGGAFVGGMVAGHVLTRTMDNSERRTRAAEYQAYNSQPQVVYQQAPPASSGQGSAEQRLNELDSLAAKGYISQQEYQARRQRILDSL